MIFREGLYIAGKYNNENVEGYVIFNENDEPFITGKKCLVSEMKSICLKEAQEGGVEDIINNDFTKLDKDKVKKIPDREAERIGDAREKELIGAGVKMQKGEYKDKFVAAKKALAAVGDVAAGDLNDSEILDKYKEEVVYNENDVDWKNFNKEDEQELLDQQLDAEYNDDFQIPEEEFEDAISDSLTNETSTDTYESPEDDVTIKVSNPNKVPVEILINKNEILANKEAELIDDIEAELEECKDFSNKAFLNRLVEKYNLKKSVLKENASLNENIDTIIKEVLKF